MAEVVLQWITKRFGPATAVSELSLAIADGEFVVLLGPTGAGKTTTLRLVAGLEQVDAGRISIAGIDVTALQPAARDVAMVFQQYSLYPHYTVFDNLAFPLRNRGVPEADVDRKVKETLEMTGLADRAHRRARGLTADQKQKISLGRGLVRSEVNAILFDEPLTVIDPHMKWVLRSQLKQLHRRFAYTMVYVTHDQTEALTFADQVVVMKDGEIVQIGTPVELYEDPKHTFVGHFIDSPGMNVLPFEVVSFLLLAALIGAIVLARKDEAP